jgi:hypothetical protein
MDCRSVKKARDGRQLRLQKVSCEEPQMGRQGLQRDKTAKELKKTAKSY